MTDGKILADRLLQVYYNLVRRGIVTDQSDFLQKIGMKNALFTEIKKGRTGTKIEKLMPLVEVFGINHAWLLTGEGEMFSDRGNVQDKQFSYQNSNSLTQKTQTNMDAVFLKEYFDALKRRDEQITELIRQQGELITKIPGASLGGVKELKEKIG